MKKLALFVAGLTFALPIMASAASFVVSPSNGSYTVGDTIVLNVSTNPASTPLYTAMLDARFSSNTLQVVSFTLNDSMLPLKQSGYDALDNTNGILTKTGGYTGGISSTAAFGVIVLQAKAAGTGTFTVVPSSKLLDANNTNQQSGTQTSSFTITAKPVVETAPAPQKTSQPVAKPTTKATTTTTTANATETPATSTQVASAAATGLGSTFIWLFGILALLAAFGVGFFAGRRT